MAPKPNMALLFHPKKGAKKDTPAPSPKKSSAVPRPKPIPEDEDDGLKLPEGPFQEFKVMSSALNGWKYDVMKFDSRKPVDLTTWPAPIKLNRKELRRDDGGLAQVAVAPMLGLDGKPVVGPDGKFVMVDAEGKPIHADSEIQKKTRQVYVVPEETRQLRREERYPWVMEDANQVETWVGQLEDVTKSGTHAFFMPAANDIFKFVPAHRWYKFQKKLKHDLPTDTITMESAYSKSQTRDPQAWLHNRTGRGPSADTAAMFKAESEGRALSGSSSLVHTSGQSLAPGGKKLKAVDSGMNNLFGGDDEDDGGDSKRKREKEYGGEGDLDEMVYEADFADDEEKIDMEDNDEETRDMEMSRTTKSYPACNDAYDSDEEKNPYASSEEEEEEPPTEPVVLPPPVQPPPQADSRSGSQTPQPAMGRPTGGPKADSRATSPALSPGLGGHSVVAKRATSPKAPKQKANGASRGNSPLASRATSPIASSRATSPVASGTNGSQKKRKATDEFAAGSPSPTSPNGHGQGAPPKAKKRKGHNGAAAPVGELEDKMVIEWLRNTPNATTRDCIQHFQPYLTDEAKKSKFTALIKEVAQLKGASLYCEAHTEGPTS
ncbi:transcription initiation factor [Mycena rebaudengoi]|nr:transcription initiation factor [Mycena rebaudengoi]